jgi:hypothetical protein
LRRIGTLREGVKMSEQAMYRNLMELGLGAEVCMQTRLHLPTLTLLYSAIDIAAWLTNDDPSAKVGKRFMAWVDQYLLPSGSFHCNAADLYAARCGIVHTLTPDSDMSVAGKARLVAYTWGNRSADDLQQLVTRSKLGGKYVVVCIEDLYGGWKAGVQRLVDELDKDPGRAARVYTRAAKFFDQDSTETLDGLITATAGR